ncbi:DUF2975 domain-containing protein [uncultured Clostridium sp.]|uniref:DUF2975 domain-containing protein n=1 Tax=uncultured Clostridium sp. TaxID=59620 RepID=UPI003216EDFF
MLFRKILYIASVLSVVITIIAGATLPNIVNWYLSNISNAGLDIGGGVKIFLYITYIPFLLILISVMKLSGKLLKGSPFCKDSINALKMISICAFIAFVTYLAGTIFIYKNLICIVITFATMMVFIISSVVRELINNGIELQEENDLTI